MTTTPGAPLPASRRLSGLALLILTLPLLLISCSSPTAREDQAALLSPVLGIVDAQNTLDAISALALIRQPGTATVYTSQTPSMGFQRAPAWFAVEIKNDGEEAARYLVAGRPHTDNLDLYLFNKDELLVELHHGDRLPWHQRPFDDNELIFPITLPANTTVTALFRMETSGAVELPISIHDNSSLMRHKFYRLTFTGLYFGAILSMALFNLLLFIAIRDKSYLFYVIYLCALAMFLATRASLAFELFWPNSPWLNDTARAFFALLSSSAAILFSASFLQLTYVRPKLDLALNIASGILASAAVASWFFDPHLTLRVATLNIVALTPLLLAAVILRIRDGYRPARFFLLSFTPIVLLAPLFVLKTLTLISSNWVIDHAFEIGSSLEAWLLSFALAYRLTMLKAENERIQRDATIDLERRVQERTDELNRALNARSEFLAVMSHEIRTPLNGILGTVDMLKDSSLDSDQRRKIHIIEQSGNTLVALINDILDYSRIESGKLPIDEEQFTLPALVRESAGLFEHRANINGNTLNVNLSDNLGLLCRGDPVRLRQIIVNLVGNAVKFTEGGEVQVNARRDEQNRSYVMFEIQDTGIGIHPNQVQHLFELFQQGDGSTRRRYGGTGLGLAICRQLVELMGGEIGVDSELGNGSRFWFRLPLPEVTREQRRAAQVEEMDEHSTPPARLLIVDDNHVNLLVAQGLAKKLGHEVETAESGPEALAVLLNDSRPFDLVLMDCEMPEMDGFETCREIIRLQAQGKVNPIPVVALTAHAVPDKIRQCHEAGMVSHIAKPINANKLDREIRAVLKPNQESAGENADQHQQG